MKRLLVGRPIPTSAQAGERLVKILALAVFVRFPYGIGT
jgi:hypothetical protein